MVDQDGLADAPRPHENHGAANARFLDEFGEAPEIGARLQSGVVLPDSAAVPPGVVGSQALMPLG